jgi:hypothetical protein
MSHSEYLKPNIADGNMVAKVRLSSFADFKVAGAGFAHDPTITGRM